MNSLLAEQHMKYFLDKSPGDVQSLSLTSRTDAWISLTILGAYSDGRNRPIVIRFCMGVVRGQVWKAKTKLKGSGLVLAEFLTKDRQTLFQTARKHFGLSNVWTSNGSVHVKTPDGTRHRVATLKELNCLVEQHPTSSPSPNTIKASAAAANSAEPISANVPEGSNSSRSRRIRR
ncbi:hypothetical protein ACJJTC_002566 [Scirpophaga incertulas]